MALENNTTVVGACSLPRWYDTLEKKVEARALSIRAMLDAHRRCTQAALLDQEVVGIDVVTAARCTDARTTAMLNFFWQKVSGFEKDPTAEYGIVTRPKPITPKDEGVFYPAAWPPVSSTGTSGWLVEEFWLVSRYARNPDNVKMTGPNMLAKVAHDEYYDGDIRAMTDLTELSNQNSKELEEVGCMHIQLDEPLFAVGGITREEVEAVIDAKNQAGKALGPSSGSTSARATTPWGGLRRTDRPPLLRRRAVPDRADL